MIIRHPNKQLQILEKTLIESIDFHQNTTYLRIMFDHSHIVIIKVLNPKVKKQFK